MRLVEGLKVRPPVREDAQAVADMLNACEVADGGEPEWAAEELLDDWDRLELATDAWLVLTHEEKLVGYAYVKQLKAERYLSEIYLHPAGSTAEGYVAILRRTEERIREMNPEATVVVHINSAHAEEASVLAREGFELVRHFLRMSVDLTEPPVVPDFPPGVAVRPFRPEQDLVAAFEAKEEAFADHWGHLPGSLEKFAEETQGRIFDPSLWFLAWQGDEVAGLSLAMPLLQKGWVRTLGVRRAWRRKGLALALLRYTFAEFYRRGVTRVELGVDAASLTGATRLYEKAGMRTTQVNARYQKDLKAK